VPIRGVRRRAARDGGVHLSERGGPIGCKQRASAGAEVDVVREVVPIARDELGAPLRVGVDVPSKGVVRGSGLTVNESVLDLGKMTLEESNLMLVVGARRVGRRSHQGEVVEEFTRSKVRRRLRDDFGTLHGLPVPERRAINCDLDSLSIASICRILVAGRESEVIRRRLGAVDIPLPRLDLVGERPLVKVRDDE